MISRVYKITNDIDDKTYIGSSNQKLSKRMGQHRTSCRRGVKKSLYTHMLRIGIEHFRICPVEVLTDATKDQLRIREDFHIKAFDTVKNGLNGRYEHGQKCEHGRRRDQCIPCGGSQICEHGRLRKTCIPCGGSQICEHGKQRYRCKFCGGSQICEHGRLRQQCKPCGGSQICEHGKQRYRCKPCGGTSICEHGRQRLSCKTCSPHKCDVCDKILAGQLSYNRHLNSEKHVKTLVDQHIKEYLGK